jgi:signal transduction histidine kinase
MKLTTRLKIFSLFAISVIVLIAAIAYWRFSQEDLATSQNKISENIVAQAFNLTILTDEYIKTYGARAERQWLSQHTKLNNLIESYATQDADDRSSIAVLQHQQQVVFGHFSRLEEIIHSQETSDLARQGIQRLNGQLAVDMQTIVSVASHIADATTKQLTSLRQTTNIFILLLITLLVGSFIVSYLLFANVISRSIKQLIRGTHELAAGHLAFRLDSNYKDEFGELAANFNKMAADLQELESAKDEFITIASHELRTPMTAIKGYVSMILKGSFGEVPEKIQFPLERTSKSIDLEVKLINDLLDASRIKTRRIAFMLSNFPVGHIVDEVADPLRPFAQEKGITFSIMNNPNSTVHADADWVKQIVSNIVGNALKFTDKGTIDISFKVEKKRVLIVVQDTGIGIRLADQERLFRKFQQISSKEKGKPAGTGLGLFISREIARQLGGDVWLEKSVFGEGSTFVIALPKSKG